MSFILLRRVVSNPIKHPCSFFKHYMKCSLFSHVIGGGKSHFKSLLGLCECLHVMFVMWGKRNKTSLRHVNISFIESEKLLNTNDNSLLISLSADGEISLKMSILRRRLKSVLILGVGQTDRIYWKRELLVSHFILQLLKPGCLIFYIVAMTLVVWYAKDLQYLTYLWTHSQCLQCQGYSRSLFRSKCKRQYWP